MITVSTQGREMCRSEACGVYTLRRTHGGCLLLWPEPLHLNTGHASFFRTAVYALAALDTSQCSVQIELR